MHRLLRPVLLILIAACAAGCGAATDPPPAASNSATPAADIEVTNDADGGNGVDPQAPLVQMPATSPRSGDAPPPNGRWFLRESYPPTAAWGVPDSEGILTFDCDRGGRQLVMQRQAVGVADAVRVVTIEADGTRMDYPAERVDTTLAPMLVTRIALDAPILDRLLSAQRIRVAAGQDAVVTSAPGGALAAVVAACRREPDPAPG